MHINDEVVFRKWLDTEFGESITYKYDRIITLCSNDNKIAELSTAILPGYIKKVRICYFNDTYNRSEEIINGWPDSGYE